MTKQELSARQLAFFLERVTSDTAKREWNDHVRAAIETWLATPLAELATADALVHALETATAKHSYDKLIRPISREIHAHVASELRKEKRRVGNYVPESARKKIDDLLEKPKLVSEKLLRRVLEQEAMEETMRDVLFDALTEFNARVNPFIADWGLPAILKKLGPFGLGPVAKSIDSVRAEFDKRMEPEMRKFLQGFSRKALTRTGDLMAKNEDSPAFIELRKAIARWIYEQEVREFMLGFDDDAARLVHGAAIEIAEHASLLQDFRSQQRNAIQHFFSKHASDPLRKVIAAYGGHFDIDTDAFAAATWPALVAILKSESVRAHVKKLLDEFWETVSDDEF